MRAEIYWLTEKQGGRTIPIQPHPDRGNSYWANTQAKNLTSWSVGVYFKNQKPVQTGTSDVYEIKFVAMDAYRQFEHGDPIFICEGSRVIGQGVILE